MEPETEQTPKQRIEQWRQDNGVQFRFTYIPPKERPPEKLKKGEKPWRCLKWRVTLIVNGRDRFCFDYSAGEAHCPSYKPGGRTVFVQKEAVNVELETGRHCIKADSVFGPRLGANIEPDGCDVLYSLAMDAGVIDFPNFESWADDYGYDPDSRDAERVYRLCLEQALQLRAAVGNQALEALRVACQDY